MNEDDLITEREGSEPDAPLEFWRYLVMVGFNFGCTEEDGDGTRVEPGPLKIVLPPDVLADLIDADAIVEVQ